jgi:hypothetical protein
MVEDISIIELQPNFVYEEGGWAHGLAGDSRSESLNPDSSPPPLPFVVKCRSKNAFALAERVYNANQQKQPVYLRYYDPRFGTEERRDLILAARAKDTPDGQILIVWVSQHPEATDNLAPV